MMIMKNKNYISLIAWITSFILIGFLIGYATKPEINTWYSALNRSPLTPPNYIFPIAWTILYALIATCGWIISRTLPFQNLMLIKILYVIQLLLNWSWTPLFFHYHFTKLSLLSLLVMDSIVVVIIYMSYTRIRLVSQIMTPYLLWLLFATYLNFYIHQYN